MLSAQKADGLISAKRGNQRVTGYPKRTCPFRQGSAADLVSESRAGLDDSANPETARISGGPKLRRKAQPFKVRHQQIKSPTALKFSLSLPMGA